MSAPDTLHDSEFGALLVILTRRRTPLVRGADVVCFVPRNGIDFATVVGTLRTARHAPRRVANH